MYFQNYGVLKTWLIKSLKSAIKYDTSRANM